MSRDKIPVSLGKALGSLSFFCKKSKEAYVGYRKKKLASDLMLRKNKLGTALKAEFTPEEVTKITAEYINGYSKGRAEFIHRFRVGLLLGVVGSVIGTYLAYNYNNAIDKRSKLQGFDQQYKELFTDFRLLLDQVAEISDEINIFSIYSDDFIPRIRQFKSELKIIEIKSQGITQQLDDVINVGGSSLPQPFFNERIRELRKLLVQLDSELKEHDMLLSIYILLAAGDRDRALRKLRTHIVESYHKHINDKSDEVLFIEMVKALLSNNATNQLKLSIPLISFIYLIKNDQTKIYSILSNSVDVKSPYVIIMELGEVFGFTKNNDIEVLEKELAIHDHTDIPDYVHALYHNVAYAYFCEAKRLSSESNNTKNNEYIHYLLKVSSSALQKSIEIWSSNPRFMPYYSYSELKKFTGDPEASMYVDISSKLKPNKLQFNTDEERPYKKLT